MKITQEWLKKQDACKGGYEWFCNQTETNLQTIIEKLMKEDHFRWASWLITRILNNNQKVMYAIYAAELVLYLYEKRYPNDYRPHKAIETAKIYLSNAAAADADAAAAIDAAYTAVDAYIAVAGAAVVAAVDDTAYAYADAAADAAVDAAYTAVDADAAAVAAADADIKSKIISYGIKLLEEQNNENNM